MALILDIAAHAQPGGGDKLGSASPKVSPLPHGPRSVRPLFDADDKSFEAQRVGLEFRNIKQTVLKGNRLQGREPKVLLQDVTGYCKSGEVLFLMGPSGAGKTTLLDCLGGRTARLPDGDILFEGQPATPQMRKNLMRYCMQDPAFHEALTVQETLWVAARLCCPSMKETRRRVDWVISSLGLTECRNTLVGGMIFRGISGGQRKRLGIGEQVLAGAPLLFLDEPTSSLDSSAALQIAELVRVLARFNGTTVICSIHQPSDRVLSSADNVLLLATGGRQTFFGSPDTLQTHFESALGESKVPRATAIEWVMEMISLEVGGATRVDKCVAAWVGKEPIVDAAPKSADDSKFGSRKTSLLAPLRHVWALFYRAMLNTYRNPLVAWVRMMMYVALSLVIGSVWWDVGTDLKAGDVNNLAGALFFVAAMQAFMSVSSMPSFLEDKSVFVKERAGGSYSVISYNVAAFLASTPFVFIIALFCSIIIYFMLSLSSGFDKFMIYMVNLFLTVACAEAVVYLVASIIPVFIVALAASAFIFGTFMIVQGFFIRLPSIPDGWRWLHYFTFHGYSLRIALYNEFESRVVLKDLDIVPPAPHDVSGKEVLTNFGFEDEDILYNIVLILVMIFTYRVAATLWQYFFHTGLK